MKRTEALMMRRRIETAVQSLPANDALAVVTLHPEWREGMECKEGMRLQHGGKLYEVNKGKTHTAQADWTPDVTTSLWTPLDVEHTGTLEDPIPAVSGMEYVKGKYYSEDGTIYLMNREGMADGETIVLHFLPSQLVGQYFEVIE